jgi:putative FmdB family regulatory protein
MPIYEYCCKKCNSEFEELVFNRDEKVSCPECGSGRVMRALSVFSYSSGGVYHSSEGGSCDNCSSGNCSHCGGH